MAHMAVSCERQVYARYGDGYYLPVVDWEDDHPIVRRASGKLCRAVEASVISHGQRLTFEGIESLGERS